VVTCDQGITVDSGLNLSRQLPNSTPDAGQPRALFVLDVGEEQPQ
jgi:hypothetical protein